MAVSQTFTASRNATWAPTLVYPYAGPQLPLTGGRIDMQLRLYGGQVGSAKLDLASIPFTDVIESGTAGEEDEMRLLVLSPVIKPGPVDGSVPNTLHALPGLNTPNPGDPQRFDFDILITYADGASERLSSGTFIASPGVTIV